MAAEGEALIVPEEDEGFSQTRELNSKTGCKWNKEFPIAVISWMSQLIGLLTTRPTEPISAQHKHNRSDRKDNTNTFISGIQVQILQYFSLETLILKYYLHDTYS